MPAGRDTRAAVVLMHGFSWHRLPWLAGFVPWLQRRYHVLQFDFRGHGSSDDALISLGTLEQRDVAAAVHFLAGRGLGPIALMGISMGGSVAIMAAPDLPVAAVVADAAYADLRDPIANRMREVGYPLARLGASLVLAAASLRARVWLRSPMGRVAQIAPRGLLLISPGEDRLVSPHQSQRMFRAAGEPKELFVVPGAAHAEAHPDRPGGLRAPRPGVPGHVTWTGKRPYNRADLYPSPGSCMATRVLVVDDDLNIQRVLVFALKQEGYEVTVASDGAAGVEMALDARPDLILMDVAMPKLDGYAATQQIRAAEKGVGRVPIIMLTSEADVEQRVRGLRAGADDDIVKPFHPLELMARIKALLAQAGGQIVTKTGDRGADARQAVCLLPGQGRGGHHHHRDQHRHRARAGGEAPDRADRRQPAVRRPARLPRPRARHRLDRERRQRAGPRPGPVPDHDGQPSVGDRPAARPADAGGRRHRGRASASGAGHR